MREYAHVRLARRSGACGSASRCRCRRGRSCGTVPSPCRTPRARASTCCGRRALLEQEHRLADVLLEHAVADEAVAHAGDDRGLADASCRPASSSPARPAPSPRRARPRAASSRCAGLKKCVPTTSCGPARRRARCGRRRAWTCWWRGSRRASCDAVELAEHVLLDAPCPRTPPRRRGRPPRCRRARRVGASRAMRSSIVDAVKLALARRAFVDRAGSPPRPCRARSAIVSTSVTGRPASRKFIAMPPPIVPAPIDGDALRSSRVGVSAGRSGILAAARSAKNAWRSARDSGVCTSSWNSARSMRRPSSNGLLDRGRDRIDALERRRQALAPRPPRPLVRAKPKNASAFGCVDATSRTRGSGRGSVGDLARERDRGRRARSPSTMSSNSAVPASSRAGTGRAATRSC